MKRFLRRNGWGKRMLSFLAAMILAGSLAGADLSVYAANEDAALAEPVTEAEEKPGQKGGYGCRDAADAAADIELKDEEKKRDEVSSSRDGETEAAEGISFDNSFDTLAQYVLKDQSGVLVINENRLYRYSFSEKQMSLVYTFPQAEYYSEGYFFGSQGRESVFIDEKNGLLYYMYNVYENAYSEDEIVHIICYDLEAGNIRNTKEITGHIGAAVGADASGNIYLSVSDYTKDSRDQNALIYCPASGAAETVLPQDDEIIQFVGFCQDGTFYVVREYMAYSLYGYENLMGALVRGRNENGKVTLEDGYMFFVKNIYFANYNTPAEILNDTYLAVWGGELIPLDSIKNQTYSQAFSFSADYEMGSEYDYLYNVGCNLTVRGNTVFALKDNHTIYQYDLKTGKSEAYYRSANKIFNIKACGNDIAALERTDGGDFLAEKISSAGFSVIRTTKYKMDDFAVYKGRTKNDIISRYSSAVPGKYGATLYAKKGSGSSPFKESELTAGTMKNALNFSNYIRWLGGLTPFASSDSTVWKNAARGAVLLSASDFSHTPSKPKGMSDDFYKAAYEATSSSNIAMNWYENQSKIVRTVRQFMDDDGDTVPGHRNTFNTRNAVKIAYGFFGNYAAQTVEWTDDPNPSGTAAVNNNEAVYAWPAPGYFPVEEISEDSVWTVNLNTDKLSLSNVPLEVTITDLDTKKVYKRTGSDTGLYRSSYWGEYISFTPPEGSSCDGKKFLVKFTNLENAEGFPAELEYTVRFFSYKGKYTVKGKTYFCDEDGKLSKKKSLSEMTISEIKDQTYTGSAIKPAITVKYGSTSLKKGTDYTLTYKKNKAVGTASVTIKGKGSCTGKKTLTFKILPKAAAGVKAAAKGYDTVKVSWKKASSVDGYIVYRAGSEKGKYKKIATVPGAKTVSFTDKALKTGKTYYYKVRTYKTVSGKKWYGKYSAVVSAKPELTKTKIVSVKNSASRAVNIKWKKVKDADGYVIYRSAKKDTSYKKVKKIAKGGTVSFTDQKLKKGKTYYYKIKTYKTVKGKKIYSDYSPVKSCKVKK